MINKLISFNESLNRYINAGQPEVTDQIFFERMMICKECEHFNRIMTQCKQCGCFLHVKARWSTEECPLGRWKTQGDFSYPAQPVPSGDCNCRK